MPPPASVTQVAEQAHAETGPWGRADRLTADWELLRFLEAALYDLQEVEDLARDTDDGPGWSVIMDVNRAPTKFLPWLAQFVGVRIGPNDTATDELMRAKVAAQVGFQRGTVGAMRAAAQVHLTGAKSVRFFERYQGNAYRLRVHTITAETPDAAVVEAALRAAKPAGIVLEYAAVAGQLYLELEADHANYAAVEAAYADYADVRDS